MKLRNLLASLLLVASGPTLAGTLTFGNDVAAPGPFTDIYNFSISGPANSSGNVIWNFFSISNLSVSLTGSGGLIATDTSPLSFAFNGLTAGVYSLGVSGVVTGQLAAYGGLLTTSSGTITSIATERLIAPTSVPEPGTLALFGLALIGAAFATRRGARGPAGPNVMEGPPGGPPRGPPIVAGPPRGPFGGQNGPSGPFGLQYC